MLRREGYTVRQRERVMWVPGTACPDPRVLFWSHRSALATPPWTPMRCTRPSRPPSHDAGSPVPAATVHPEEVPNAVVCLERAFRSSPDLGRDDLATQAIWGGPNL
jgi:hypothetical protein